MTKEQSKSNTNYKQQYNAISNGHGLYNSEQFVLRLSFMNHQLLDVAMADNSPSNCTDESQLKAYSTYIHETIHWWQHIGSTSGFVLSLCYPLQTHSNVKQIKDWCCLGTPVKSIKKAATDGEIAGKTHLDERQAIANTIANNTMDFENYKIWLLRPDLEKDIFHDPYFESQGHCFGIVYMNLLDIISSIFDKQGECLNFHELWEAQFVRLNEQRVHGYYYGTPITHRKVGVVEIYEGQACFSQMQFLAGIGACSDKISIFKAEGILYGEYEAAFSVFLDLADLSPPEIINDSIIGLFLLICDLSINPTEGFPCDIIDFENFVHSADPGIRFEVLCRVVAKRKGELQNIIKTYSQEEYLKASRILLENAGLQSITEGWDAVSNWLYQSDELRALMEEHKAFDFRKENTPLRVLLSCFIAFTMDKKKFPEFFCWPGYWKSHRSADDSLGKIWSKHVSLFTDAECNDGIFIRKFEGISEDKLHKTLTNFFGGNLIYDLSRQWVLKNGEFSFDFRWLSESVEEGDWKDWGNEVFKNMYGVSIDDIDFLK